VRPGDVFASHSYHTPPADSRWVLLSRHPDNRVWLRVADFRRVTVTSGAADDGTSRWLAPVSAQDLGAAGLIVWRATSDGAAGRASAVLEHADGLALDPVLTSTACEAVPQGRTGFSCSGIAAVRPDAVAGYGEGDLRVGVETDGHPGDVTLTFAQLQPPGAPPR
jgi:hypothetical protein